LELLESKIRWLGMPRGGLVYLTDFGFPAGDVAWWDTKELPGGLRVTAVPVQHNGWRYGIDRSWMTTGYTGWVIEYRGQTVYFGGDTAYAPERFRATRERFPHIDLALLPIAPIHPRDFMRKSHLDPKEALSAADDLGARVMVPIHFGTFVNSLDEEGEAERVLREEMARRRLPRGRVEILRIGEQRVIVAEK